MKKALKIAGYIISVLAIVILTLTAYVYFNKAKILKNLTSKMSETLQADVAAEDLQISFFSHFPSLSLTLVNAQVHDSLFAIYKTPLIAAEKVYLATDVIRLITGRINVSSLKIKNASFNIFKTTEGYSNDYIFKSVDPNKKKKPEDGNGKVNLDIGQLSFDNVKVSLRDSLRKKYFGIDLVKIENRFESNNDTVYMQMAGNLHFGGLGFNLRKGIFLENMNATANFLFRIVRGSKQMQILPESTLAFYNHTFFLSGELKASKPSYLLLDLKNENVPFDLVASIVTDRIGSKLAKFKWSGGLKTHFVLKTRLDTTGTEPEIDIEANTQHPVKININTIGIEQVKLMGKFSNHFDTLKEAGDENTRIDFKELSGAIEGFPFKGTLTVNNLSKPAINLNVKSTFNLSDQKDMVDESMLALNSGKFDMRLKYDGPVDTLYNNTTKKLIGTLNGSINITSADFDYIPKKFRFTNLNVNCNFNESDITLNHLSGKINRSSFDAKGAVSELIPFILIPDAQTVATLDFYSQSIYIDDFLQPAESKTTKKVSTKKAKNAVARKINDIISSVNLNATFSADKIYFKKFIGTKATAQCSIGKGTVALNKFYIENSGGSFTLDVTMQKSEKNQSELWANVTVKNAYASELFESCSNFGQDKITGKNIKGTINIKANYDALLNSRYEVIPASMQGQLDFSIREGELNNLNVLGEVGKFVLRDRDFEHITFQDIESKAVLQGTNTRVDQLDIASNILSMRINGIYSFANNTDLSIQIPLKNLERSNEKYNITLDDLRNYKGPNVFLRAKSKENGKVSIGYDPLKKFRKEKK